MERRTFLTRLAVGTTPLVAGCTGGGGDGGQSPSPTESPAESPTPTATPEAQSAQEKYPNYEWSKLEGVTPVATTTIEMSGFEFNPLIGAFEPGTEVTVTNQDSASHTFTVPKLRIDESLGGGGSTSFTVEQTGTFDYVCTFHPTGMLGRLVVTENPPTATPTPTEDSYGGY